jgi:ectoine hydroxylase-related dioxygenase (phytanoyl-CoA dioxygenase family)
MTLQRVGADTPYDEIAAIIAADGCVVVEDLATGLVAQAKAELDDYIEKTPFGPGNFAGEHAKNVEGLVGKSEAAHALMIHDTVMAMADRILLPNCVHYQLNYTGIMHLGPGTKAQDLHRDGNIYPFRHPCPPAIMAVMWAGSEFTAANGGTVVVPGSHLWEHEREAQPHECISAEMKVGSALFYLGGVIHAGGPNSSNVQRTGIAIQYSLGWLRQEENLHFAVPPELAKTLPDRLARLVGYDFGAPFCGFVNGDDPHRLIEDEPLSERCHSYPELNAASQKINRWRWGDIEPVLTPPAVRKAS